MHAGILKLKRQCRKIEPVVYFYVIFRKKKPYVWIGQFGGYKRVKNPIITPFTNKIFPQLIKMAKNVRFLTLVHIYFRNIVKYNYD